MAITQIEIKNVKGISNESFKVLLAPLKPNLLVAPNGFGKTSIATAFLSMNSKRLALEEKDIHKGDEQLLPELSVIVNGQKLTADKNRNEIRQQFDVLVINSGLTPKAKKHFKGAVSSSLEVKPIVICKIPEKAAFTYSVAEARIAFGASGKILPNISDVLKDSRLLDAIRCSDLSKFIQKRIQTAVADIALKVNEQNGGVTAISQWIIDNCIDDLRALPLLSELGNRLVHVGLVSTEVEGFFAAYQIAVIYSSNPEEFSCALARLEYTSVKAQYTDLLSNFKSSNWHWATVEENKKTKELGIKFPQAHHLSNGQRDVITLVVQLHKALYQGAKKPLILVIDEVFDYLDDANLVAFQYYVTSIIEAYKGRGQILYPIILTHLDPGVFFDFCFNKHKIQINYLQVQPIGKAQDTLRLIEARDKQAQIKDRLESHWFHFHFESCEILPSDWPSQLRNEWRRSQDFHSYAETELTRYLNGKNFDPLAVCFAVRIAVEKLGYGLLSESHQKDKFLEVKKTNNKLDFVASTGVDIPESYFLLGLIYNTNLHWNPGRDFVSPLSSKLNHPTIKQLILEVANAAFAN